MKEIMNSRRNFVQQTIRASIAFTFIPEFFHPGRPQFLPGSSASSLPWQDARVMWNLGDRTDSSHRNSPLIINGEGVQAGIALQGSEKDESLLRGGDASIFFDSATGQFGAEGNLKTSTPYPELGKGPSYIPAGKPVRMHLFIDRSLLEVFVNGHTCSGIFKCDSSATGIDLLSEEGQARLTSLDIWEIKPVWTS